MEEKNRSSLKALQMKEKKISETEKNAFVAKENIEYENEDNEFLEDYYKKTIQDLTTQNENLKNELEEVRKIAENSIQIEKEDTKESLNTTKTSPQK